MRWFDDLVVWALLFAIVFAPIVTASLLIALNFLMATPRSILETALTWAVVGNAFLSGTMWIVYAPTVPRDPEQAFVGVVEIACGALVLVTRGMGRLPQSPTPDVGIRPRVWWKLGAVALGAGTLALLLFQMFGLSGGIE